MAGIKGAEGVTGGRRESTPVTAHPAAQAGDSQMVRAAIASAKNGDMDGLNFLYARYAAIVLRYVNSVVKNEHEAEDITQNIFLKLFSVIHTYEPRGVPFVAWVLRIARNTSLDHLRARRAIPFEEVPSVGEDLRQVDSERRIDLCWALGQLPKEQRSVLVLRHIHGLSPAEIARVLGKSESSIDGLHHRGRKRIQSALRDLGAAPVVAKARAS